MDTACRRWILGFGILYAITLILQTTSWLTPPTIGDLTRIGGLSETEFRSQSVHAEVPPELLLSSPINQADILVVGDSFSVSFDGTHRTGLAWQAKLVKQGLRVATLHWNHAQPMCAGFSDWLKGAGFKGHTVILQTVERELERRLLMTPECTRARPAGMDSSFRALPFDPGTSNNGLNWRANLMFGAVSVLHTHRALSAAGPLVIKAPNADQYIRVVPIVDGCKWFSHRSCQRGLFLEDDQNHPELSPAHIVEMAKLNQEAESWKIFWLVVPNKSSLYLSSPGSDGRANQFAAIERASMGPDLYKTLSELKLQQHDVYLPNDSHLSPTGYQAVGTAVVEWVQRR
jgi:hypothetical protein